MMARRVLPIIIVLKFPQRGPRTTSRRARTTRPAVNRSRSRFALSIRRRARRISEHRGAAQQARPSRPRTNRLNQSRQDLVGDPLRHCTPEAVPQARRTRLSNVAARFDRQLEQSLPRSSDYCDELIAGRGLPVTNTGLALGGCHGFLSGGSSGLRRHTSQRGFDARR